MRVAALVGALLALPPALGTGTQSQARFTDALSLLSQLNANPQISLSQSTSGAAAAEADALGGLGRSAATVGSDAAADAVSDSIKDLFNLDDQTPRATIAGGAATKTVPPPKKVPPAQPSPKVPSAPKAKVLKPQPAPKAQVPAAPKAAAKTIVPAAKQALPAPKAAAKKTVSATKQAEHSVAPLPKQPTVVAHPSVAKKQSHMVASKSSKVSEAVAGASLHASAPNNPEHPLPSKASATVSSGDLKPKKASAMAQSKAPQKVEELEAELSALKAKLSLASAAAPVIKTSKVTAAVPAAVPAAPAVVPSKKTSVVEKTPAEGSLAKTVVKPPLPTKVDLKPTVQQPELAAVEPTVHQPSHMEEKVADRSPEITSPVLATEVAVSKAVPSVELTTMAPSTEVSMTMVPDASAPQSVVTADVTMTMVPMVAPEPIITPAVSAPQPVSFFGSAGRFFETILFGVPAPPAPLPKKAPPANPDAARPAFTSQNIERTAASAQEDSMADVSIADEFSQKEREDISLIDRVKREDRALRLDAETPKKPSMPAPANFQANHGTHISQFWGSLADEDADIEQALAKDGDDLSEYQRLTSLQDARVAASVDGISGPRGEHLAIERRALRKAAASGA